MLRRLPVLLLVAIAVVVALASPAAAKGKLNCRVLNLTGAAGLCTPPDHVQIRVVDALGNEIHRSCDNVHVLPNETAGSFGARLPRDLGSAGDGDCGTHYFDANPPTKKCLNDTTTGASCQYKWKASKQTLTVCCWAGPDCKGVKIGNYCTGTNAGAKCSAPSECPGGTCVMRTGTQGVSAQKQIQGVDLTFLPTPVPVAASTVLLALDPIAMAQLPFPALGSCRVGTASAIGALASTIADTLVSCYAQQLKGSPIAADCSTVNSDSDPTGKVDAAAAKLTAAAQACATGGTPFALGYRGCPAPCDGTVVNTCAAGLVGAPCASDAACDSSVGLGDGKCGQAQDWGAVGACMACVAQDAITTAVDDKYGSVGPGLASDDLKCQDEIGKALAILTSTHLKVIDQCQKLLDGGKTALAFCQQNKCVAPPDKAGITSCVSEDDCAPPDARLCKYADQKGVRAFAESQAKAELDKGCLAADLTNLDSCATDLPGLEDCVIQNARDASEAISDAVFPEGIGH